MKKLVIVAPTFNEEENIEDFITNTLAQQIRLNNVDLELLISDSISNDKTKEIVQKMQKKEKKLHFLESKTPGPGKLGAGLIEGLDYATSNLKADYLITMEADLTNDVNKIPEIADLLSKFEVVICSRYINGGRVVNWSLWRKFLSYFANLILRTLSGGSKLHEFTNLYRGFHKDVWQKLRPELIAQTDWLFVPAFVFAVIQGKFKTVEIPYTFYDRFGGRSKMQTPSYTKNLLIFALKYRLNRHGAFS